MRLKTIYVLALSVITSMLLCIAGAAAPVGKTPVKVTIFCSNDTINVLEPCG